MTRTSTPNSVVRYLYQELSENEARWLNHRCSQDPELNVLLQELRPVKDLLDRTLAEPSDESVEKILAFSRHYGLCRV